MKKNMKIRSVPYRRKGEGKTDYRKRLRLLISRAPRLVVRTSGKNTTAQVVVFEPKGDRVLASASSRELVKHGWQYARNNQPAAYLVGLLVGIKAKKAGIKSAIADVGSAKPVKKSLIYTIIKGTKEAGIHIPVADEVLPDQKRVSGEHISEYSKKIKANRAAYEKQFSGYLARGLNPEDIPKRFEELKTKIMKEFDDKSKK